MAVTPTSKMLLAVTKSRLYTLLSTDSAWAVDTAVTIAASDNDNIDITFMETASQYVALIAAPGQPLKKWIQGSGLTAITAAYGTIPTAKSVCTVARRIVALIDPHTVVWTTTLTYDNYPVLATAKLAQTNDVGICVKSLSNLSFVAYKERSIYLARAQAGSDAGAFAFSEPLKVEGPAGVHAVVDVMGAHMYMTTNGRIAVYDGMRYPEWVADGLWFYLQDDIDPAYSNKIFGVFDYRLHTATFHYPRVGDAGLMYGAVIINLPLSNSGISSLAPFLAVMSKQCSYGYESRFNNQIDRSLLFTATADDRQSFYFDEATNTDDGTAFDCVAQTGLFPVPDMRHHHISAEIMVERADSNGSMTVYPVVSDMLENEAGTILTDKPQLIDLNINTVQEHIGFDAATRFFGLQCEWASTSNVQYAGATLYGRLLG